MTTTTEKTVAVFWLIRYGPDNVRVSSRKFHSARDAAKDTFGLAAEHMMVKPLTSRVAELRRSGYVRRNAEDPEGWARLDGKEPAAARLDDPCDCPEGRDEDCPHDVEHDDVHMRCARIIDLIHDHTTIVALDKVAGEKRAHVFKIDDYAALAPKLRALLNL